MKAIGKYIVVRKVAEEAKTDSGLLLSGEDMRQFRYSKGVVVEAGTEVKAIEKGMTLYYDKTQEFTMLIDDEQYTIIQERDVVVVS